MTVPVASQRLIFISLDLHTSIDTSVNRNSHFNSTNLTSISVPNGDCKDQVYNKQWPPSNFDGNVRQTDLL